MWEAGLQRRTTGSCEERGLDALGPYTWTFGARPFRTEAEALWQDFEERLSRAAAYVRERGAELRILLVPILYQVDREGLHFRYNYLNYDFGCATIDPKRRLQEIAERVGIAIVDSEPVVRRGFQRRLAEGNFTPFYFPADDNHINATASRYVAEALFADIARKIGGVRDLWNHSSGVDAAREHIRAAVGH